MMMGAEEEKTEPATFVVEEERPHSARKQWKEDQTQVVRGGGSGKGAVGNCEASNYVMLLHRPYSAKI